MGVDAQRSTEEDLYLLDILHTTRDCLRETLLCATLLLAASP